MAQILTPGFLKWDGLKFVLDDTIEGEPGPPGPAGSSSIFIFRPGDVQHDNVYPVFEDLMTARSLVDGPATIIIDDSIDAAEISTGTWELNRNTSIVGYRGYEETSTSGIMATLTISGDAQLLNPSEFSNIIVIGSGTSTASFVNDGDFATMNIVARNCKFWTTGSQPLFQSSSSYADYHTFELYGTSTIIKNSDTPVIDATNGVNEIHLYDNANVDGYTLQTQSFGTLVFKVYSLTVTYDTLQPQDVNAVSVQFPNGNNLSNANKSISLGLDNSFDTGGDQVLVFGEDHTIGQNNQWTVLIGGESSIIGSNVNASAIVSSRYSSIGDDVNGAGIFAGSNNGVSNYSAVVLGGVSGFATGLRSGVLAGGNNQASGEVAVVLGGYQGNASGIGSIVLAGSENIASSDNAVSMGSNGNAIRNGQLSHGVGSFGTRARFGRQILYTTAVNAAAATMGPSHLNLENGYAYMIRATVVANRVGTSQRACFVNSIFVSCSSGTATLHNSTSEYTQQPNGTSWTTVYTVSGANLICTFTPVGAGGGSTVNATVTYEWTELGNGV